MLLKKMVASLSVILATIGLSSWLFFLTNQSHIDNNKTNTKPQIDTLLEDVIATTFDKNGKPSLKLITPKMAHYTKENTTEIIAPVVSILKDNNTWYINSNSAKVIGDLDQIIFSNNVVVRHQGDDKHPTTTMYTSSLTILPDQQIAKTDEAISITQPAAKIYAIGMLANLDEGTVKLLSQAREEYAPES